MFHKCTENLGNASPWSTESPSCSALLAECALESDFAVGQAIQVVSPPARTKQGLLFALQEAHAGPRPPRHAARAHWQALAHRSQTPEETRHGKKRRCGPGSREHAQKTTSNLSECPRVHLRAGVANEGGLRKTKFGTIELDPTSVQHRPDIGPTSEN